MNYTRPRYEHWAGRVVGAIFLLIVGGLVNQFLNIPVQQQRQDDRLNAMEKHMEYQDSRLIILEEQHRVMMRQLDDLKKAHEEVKK